MNSFIRKIFTIIVLINAGSVFNINAMYSDGAPMHLKVARTCAVGSLGLMSCIYGGFAGISLGVSANKATNVFRSACNNTQEGFSGKVVESLVAGATGAVMLGGATFCGNLGYRLAKAHVSIKDLMRAGYMVQEGKLGAGVASLVMSLPLLASSVSYFVNLKNLGLSLSLPVILVWV